MPRLEWVFVDLTLIFKDFVLRSHTPSEQKGLYTYGYPKILCKWRQKPVNTTIIRSKKQKGVYLTYLGFHSA